MKFKKIVSSLGLLLCLGVGSTPAHAETYTLFSDKGIVPGFSSVPTYGGCGPTPLEPNIGFNGRARDIPAPEGFESWKSTQTNSSCPAGSYVGWGISFDTGQNLSRFSSGALRFWVYTSTGRMQVEIKDTTNPNTGNPVTFFVPLDSYIAGRYNQWIPISIPFAGNLRGSGLSSVRNPVLFTASATPVTFYIDNVRYVDSTVSPVFQTALKNRTNQSPATQITWSSTHLPAQWVLADQYIELHVDASTTTWGVQIYTDNLAEDAVPAYTGVISSFTQTPAGLVDTVNPTRKLPLAWATRSIGSTVTVVSADPDNEADPNSFQWLMMEDASQVAVPSQRAVRFFNGDPFITVMNNQGIHFAQSPLQFGPENSPIRIYLEANFQAAVTPRTYQTSTLRLEFFYL